MPGPFPGMDPYLEHPLVFPGVHSTLIALARERLNEILPAHYAADIGERLYLVQPERSVYPDVSIAEWKQAPSAAQVGGSGAAVATRPEPPWVLTAHPEEHREAYVTVLDLRPPRRIVTIIEILSPANKAPGAEGNTLYRRKQQEVLGSDISLVEIDLLRGGEHTAAPPLPFLVRRGNWDYLVCRHRAGEGPTYGVWPVLLRDALPAFQIPLAPGDDDVTLDLQPLFDRCYDTGRYDRTIDYGAAPEPPLAPADAAWAEALLRSRGLRP